ncbi:MAG: sigma-54-dependent transcriptional regulator [Bradymonadia bacterium]
MGILTADERRFAEAVSTLAYCNPFTPERLAAERKALGSAFVDRGPVWSGLTPGAPNPNVINLNPPLEAWIERVRQRLVDQPEAASAGERRLYGDLALYMLYNRFDDDLVRLIDSNKLNQKVSFYSAYARDHRRLTDLPGPPVLVAAQADPAHCFAAMFQIRRAFNHIYTAIIGTSAPAGRLRASVWQSVFTHDMRRYQRALYQRMSDFTTLILGPSGTGKELVARAIGLSRYIPFDGESARFNDDPSGAFHPLNLSAMSPTLIESELFGHKRGAFTGALGDRAGWLEVCKPYGTVFLDEIGELDPAIQVKLLRVLQSRTFQRIGDTDHKPFHGKIVSATHRDLMAGIAEGHFRQDLYYRLCADLVTTPSLRTQLDDAPGDVETLVWHLAGKVAGPRQGAAFERDGGFGQGDTEVVDGLAEEVLRWINTQMPADYPWPGNVRELEQCVRNVAIRGSYTPQAEGVRPDTGPLGPLHREMQRGSLTAEEVVGRYVAHVYDQTGNYVEAARRVGLDRRTVKRHVDQVRG